MTVDNCEAKYVWQTNKVTQDKTSVFPGTKWCGDGNIALHYNDLGRHNTTDMCCREHDHCPNYIPPFTRKYELFNFSPFQMFDCKCENRLHECLWNIPDPIATVVGKLYFNWIKVLQVKCFKLVEAHECTKSSFSWTHFRYICSKYSYKVVAKTERVSTFDKPYNKGATVRPLTLSNASTASAPVTRTTERVGTFQKPSAIGIVRSKTSTKALSTSAPVTRTTVKDKIG